MTDKLGSFETQDPPPGGGGGKQAGFPTMVGPAPESQTVVETKPPKTGYPVEVGKPKAQAEVDPKGNETTGDHAAGGD